MLFRSQFSRLRVELGFSCEDDVGELVREGLEELVYSDWSDLGDISCESCESGDLLEFHISISDYSGDILDRIQKRANGIISDKVRYYKRG